MNQQKVVLREQLKRQRRTLTEQQVAAASRIITKRALASVDWSHVTSVHSYLPIASHHEVDSTQLCDTIHQAYPHMKIATMEAINGSLASYWLTPEASSGKAVPAAQQFDVVIVPLLGFTDDRFRIGFGGGTYDRFLANQHEAVSIGLGYEFGHLPMDAFRPEPHDIPLTRIITEQAVYAAEAVV